MTKSADKRWIGRVPAMIFVAGLILFSGCRSLELSPENDDSPRSVGYTEMRFIDDARGGRVIDARIWHPADPTRPMISAGGIEVPPARYLLYDFGIGSVAIESGRAARDPAPKAWPKSPIVVFSHGWMGTPFEIMEVAESLAAAGFFVIAPVHAGNSYEDEFNDRGGSHRSAEEDRPADIKFVIDRVVDLATFPSSPFALKLDLDRIGVLGHSFGATSAVMAATELAGARDSRIKAFMGVVPYFESISAATFASLDIPVLLLGAARDDVAPIDKNVDRAFAEIGPNSPFVATVIAGDAGHYHFGSVDRFGQATSAAGIPRILWGVFGADRLEEGYASATDERLIAADDARRIESRCAVAFFESMLTPGAIGQVPPLFDPTSPSVLMTNRWGPREDDVQTPPTVERRIRPQKVPSK